MEIHLPIFTFRALQRKEQRFRNISEVIRDRYEIYGLLKAEMEELDDAIKRGDRKDIMCEVADLVVLVAEQANADGFSLQEIINSKLRRNNDKYNPRKIRKLQKDWGMTPSEAMQFARSRWDRRRDASYFK